ncbi:MAG: hypothetical protein WCK63_18985, partial [Betaproteobacteria bacterium]
MKTRFANDLLNDLSRQDVIPHEISRKKALSVCVALALVAGASAASFEDAEAADGKKKSKAKTYKINQVDLLQEENARLRAQLEKLQAAQNGGAAATTTGAPSEQTA